MASTQPDTPWTLNSPERRQRHAANEPFSSPGMFHGLSPLHPSGGVSAPVHAIGAATPLREGETTPIRHSSGVGNAGVAAFGSSNPLLASPPMLDALGPSSPGLAMQNSTNHGASNAGQGHLKNTAGAGGRSSHQLEGLHAGFGDDDDMEESTNRRLIFGEDSGNFFSRQGGSSHLSRAGSGVEMHRGPEGQYISKVSLAAAVSNGEDDDGDLGFNDHVFETATEFSEAQAAGASTPGPPSRYGRPGGLAAALMSPAAPLPLAPDLVASAVTSGSRRAKAMAAALPPVKPLGSVSATAAAAAANAQETFGRGQGVVPLHTSGKIRPNGSGQGYVMVYKAGKAGSTRARQMLAEATAATTSSTGSGSRELRVRPVGERFTATGRVVDGRVGDDAVVATATIRGSFTALLAPTMTRVLPRAVDYKTGEPVDEPSSCGSRHSSGSGVQSRDGRGGGKEKGRGRGREIEEERERERAYDQGPVRALGVGEGADELLGHDDSHELALPLDSEDEDEASDDPRKWKGGPSMEPGAKGLAVAAAGAQDATHAPGTGLESLLPPPPPSSSLPLPMMIDEDVSLSRSSTLSGSGSAVGAGAGGVGGAAPRTPVAGGGLATASTFFPVLSNLAAVPNPAATAMMLNKLSALPVLATLSPSAPRSSGLGGAGKGTGLHAQAPTMASPVVMKASGLSAESAAPVSASGPGLVASGAGAPATPYAAPAVGHAVAAEDGHADVVHAGQKRSIAQVASQDSRAGVKLSKKVVLADRKEDGLRVRIVTREVGAVAEEQAGDASG